MLLKCSVPYDAISFQQLAKFSNAGMDLMFSGCLVIQAADLALQTCSVPEVNLKVQKLLSFLCDLLQKQGSSLHRVLS